MAYLLSPAVAAAQETVPAEQGAELTEKLKAERLENDGKNRLRQFDLGSPAGPLPIEANHPGLSRDVDEDLA